MEVIADKAMAAASPWTDPRTAAPIEFAMLMNELAYGVALAVADGRLVHANEAARHELGRRRALYLQDGVLRPHCTKQARAFQEALAKAAQGRRSLLTLSAATGPGLAVALVPLRGDTARAGQPGQVGVLFARGSVCDPLMLCFFARSHNLTATEEQVLGVLSHGYSAPEVARQMNVAVSTVRSHVRSLCAKTRASGVRELVNRLAVLPPIAPALWREPMH